MIYFLSTNNSSKSTKMAGTVYYKVLREDMTHNGYQYTLGLNVDTKRFTKYGQDNGLHFARFEHVVDWLSLGELIAVVHVPDYANMSYLGNGGKSDRLEIISIQRIADLPVWKDPVFCLAAVKRNRHALKYVKQQTPELCLAAVKASGFALEFVRVKTPELCLLAVQRNGYAIEYVQNQTMELRMAAVNQCGLSLQFIKEQTPEICLAAVKNCGWALQYVKEQTYEICLAAIQEELSGIRYVNEQIYREILGKNPGMCKSARIDCK